MENLRLSEHYYLYDLIKSETAYKMKIHEQYEPSAYIINNLSNLAFHVLDNVKWKFPDVKVTSGYRCERLNKIVGGVSNSQHIIGQAADLVCDNMVGLWEYLQELYFDQLIQEVDHIHVSYNLQKNRNAVIIKWLPKGDILKQKKIR